MIPIIGLGNPGREYENTRHNAGFLVLDALANKYGGSFSYDKYLLAEKCIVTIHSVELMLLKPQTFMNLSGKVLDGIKRIDPFMVFKLIVVHDEVDLPIGSIKLAKFRGDGGHNGIKSINHYLGNNNYIRLRVGIAKEVKDEATGGIRQVKPNVVGEFDAGDNVVLPGVISKSLQAIENIIQNSFEKAMNEVNTK
jgi:PTH1 family peptidyl-tRNA hydrolase